jgi:hypothetical protein
MDLFSRKIVGWSARSTIDRELVLNAVLTAVRCRRPRGTLIHSDQGTQYGSDAWRRFCRTNYLEPSMSRKGNCWDNAVAESFFSSLKKERIKTHIYKTRDLAIADISDYIESFYNPILRHSRLGNESRPVRGGSQAWAARCPLKPGNSKGPFSLDRVLSARNRLRSTAGPQRSPLLAPTEVMLRQHRMTAHVENPRADSL